MAQVTFWVDSGNGKLLAGWNMFANAQKPVFKQGDTVDMVVRWVRKPQSSYSSMEEVSFGSGTLSVLVGSRGNRPQGGKWYLNYDESTSELLDYDISAEDLEIALNSMPDIVMAGGVSVTRYNDDGYKVVFQENGLRQSITGNGEALVPNCSVIVNQVAAGSGSTKAVYWVYLRQNSVTTIHTPFTTEAACTAAVNNINSHTNEIYLTSQPKSGEYTFSINGVSKTASVHLSEEGMEQLLGSSYSVVKSGDFRWRIETVNRSSLTVTVTSSASIISFSGKVGSVTIDDQKSAELLSGASEMPAMVEFVVTSSGDSQTLVQAPCTLVSRLV